MEEEKVEKKPRLKKDGTPWIPGFVKGHPAWGNAIPKKEKLKKAKDKEREKRVLDNYVKKQVIRKKKIIIDALLEQAARGNVPAIKETLERVLGKSMSPLEVSGKDGAPIQVMSFRDFGKKEEEKK